MSLHDPARWTVTYDITDPKRGGAVYRYLKKRGIPLQYSVFIVNASPADMHTLMRDLETLIDTSADDVRAYRWPAEPEIHCLGKSLLPEGLLIDAASAPRKTLTRCRAKPE